MQLHLGRAVREARRDGQTLTLTLDNGKPNAISPAVLEQFNVALDRADKDQAVVIITGQPGILSGGYDLKVMKSGREEAASLVAAGTPAELRDAAQKLTKKDANGNVTQYGIQIPSTGFAYWMLQTLTTPNGVLLANEAGTKVTFDHPTVIEALDF